MTIYMIYVKNILEILNVVQMAESNNDMFTGAARNQELSIKTVSRKQNRNLDLQLELLETTMSEWTLPI